LITVFDVPLAAVESFRCGFDASYLEKLDDGEAESLAHLFKGGEERTICSADAIVFRVLGNMDRSEQGLSLEEVLQRSGLARQVAWPYTKKFREQWTRRGVEERLYGRGRKGG
jgi:hypothetical protein